jgi:hypothetical protein
VNGILIIASKLTFECSRPTKDCKCSNNCEQCLWKKIEGPNCILKPPNLNQWDNLNQIRVMGFILGPNFRLKPPQFEPIFQIEPNWIQRLYIGAQLEMSGILFAHLNGCNIDTTWNRVKAVGGPIFQHGSNYFKFISAIQICVLIWIQRLYIWRPTMDPITKWRSSCRHKYLSMS